MTWGAWGCITPGSAHLLRPRFPHLSSGRTLTLLSACLANKGAPGERT